MKTLGPLSGIAVFALAATAPAFAADDVATLRQQLAEQRALIQAQQQQLDRQAKEFERLSQRLDAMTKSDAAQSVATAPANNRQASARPAPSDLRDEVGDLNSAALRAGDFPGAFRIPGRDDISLAIGGNVKTVAIADSNAESTGADFLPAYLGTRRADTAGGFSIDATLSKLFIDARATTGEGDQLRGYLEWDMNNSNNGGLGVNMRHVYGSWNSRHGTLLAGHTWSTFMDLKILPEGLTEPTVSGAIFNRQAQIRWSQPLSESFNLHAAIEDPNSTDVFDSTNTSNIDKTRLPDGVLGIEYVNKDVAHLRLNGIVRDLSVKLPAGGSDSKAAWGLALTGHLKVLERDKWVFGGVYGQGLGRYLLGIQSTAGSAIDPNSNELTLRDNWGVLTAYQHHWSKTLRSNAMVGHAESKPLNWQSGSTFKNSTYGAANLMWQIFPYLTMGVEYAYGQKTNNDGTSLDNHRLGIGFQFY